MPTSPHADSGAHAGPSITIVTPTLNAERFLDQCLSSIEAQHYPRLEHIVVDGGSTDATVALAHSVSGVRVIDAPGANQSAALNVGLRSATGTIVAWLNADDAYPERTLARVADAFASEPGVDVLVGDCEVVDEADRVLWTHRPGPYDFRRLLTRGNYLAQPAVFMRRDLFDRVGYLDESLEFGMDYELWLRLKDVCVRYLPVVLAHFRWHPSSKSATNLSGNWSELLTIVRRHGGGWTLPLVYSFVRAHLTAARLRATRTL